MVIPMSAYKQTLTAFPKGLPPEGPASPTDAGVAVGCQDWTEALRWGLVAGTQISHTSQVSLLRVHLENQIILVLQIRGSPLGDSHRRQGPEACCTPSQPSPWSGAAESCQT